MRATLLQIIRRLGLSHALDRARYRWVRWRNRRSNRIFAQSNPAFRLPPDYLMYESFKLDYAAYARTGRLAAEWIEETTAPFREATGSLRILDWGCGPGRVIRHLPEVFGPNGRYSGCDPNKRSIGWCRQHLAGIDFEVSGLMPPLPYQDDSFDLLYGISIFTHLSARAHQAWLAEIARVLRTGGLALITTHGDVYQQKLTLGERDIYARGQAVFRAGVTEGHRVFTAFQPPNWLRALVAKKFLVEYHRAGTRKDWGLEQDTWVLRKK